MSATAEPGCSVAPGSARRGAGSKSTMSFTCTSTLNPGIRPKRLNASSTSWVSSAKAIAACRLSCSRADRARYHAGHLAHHRAVVADRARTRQLERRDQAQAGQTERCGHVVQVL